MRRGENKTGILTTKKGALVAVALGWDFVTEHEIGIAPLRREFHLFEVNMQSIVGLERYQIQTVPNNLVFIDNDEYTSLGLFRVSTDPRSMPHRELRLRPPWRQDEPAETFVGAWSDQSFGMLSTDKKERRYLRELHEAFLAKDIAIFKGSGFGYDNCGLVVAKVSRVPREHRQLMEASHTESLKLSQLVEAIENETHLTQKLKAAGKGWFALSPQFEPEAKSKYQVRYWLNPSDQKNHKHGWFTVEELFQWIENKGPVVGQPRKS